MNILIIEDLTTPLDSIEKLLHGGGSPHDLSWRSTVLPHSNIQSRDLTQYDCILLDLNLFGICGYQLMQSLKDKQNYPPLIIIMASTNFLHIDNELQASVKGFVNKRSGTKTLVKAITTCVAGGLYVDPNYESELKEQRRFELGNVFRRPELTNRQHEVLSYITEGFSNKQIALKLGIAENTVKVHVSTIFVIFSVKNRKACIATAGKLGFL